MDFKKRVKSMLRPAYRGFLAWRNRGANVECNLCGRLYSRMRPVMKRRADGSTYIDNNVAGLCWWCNSYPRVRMLWHWFENKYAVDNLAGKRMLHVAPEAQLASKFIKVDGLDYRAIDLKCEGYDYPDYVVTGDVCSLNFTDNSFDIVICNHVLEHVKDDKRAMGEIWRVLKPGGVAVLMVPMDLELEQSYEEPADVELTAAEREERFGQFDHVRLYGRDYFERLTECGFRVERVKFARDVVERYELIDGEEIVLGIKE